MNKIVIIGASRGNGPGISAGKKRHSPVSKPQRFSMGRGFVPERFSELMSRIFMIASITSKEYLGKTQLLTY
jgi:hypothetical protein